MILTLNFIFIFLGCATNLELNIRVTIKLFSNYSNRPRSGRVCIVGIDRNVFVK
jgi:hypothetical protein